MFIVVSLFGYREFFILREICEGFFEGSCFARGLRWTGGGSYDECDEIES